MKSANIKTVYAPLPFLLFSLLLSSFLLPSTIAPGYVLSYPGCDVLKEQPTPATWEIQVHGYYIRPASQTSVNLSTVGKEGVKEARRRGGRGGGKKKYEKKKRKKKKVEVKKEKHDGDKILKNK